MKVYDYIDALDYPYHGGAEDVITVIKAHNKEAEFNQLLDREFPNGIVYNGLNDFVKYEATYIFDSLKIQRYEHYSIPEMRKIMRK